MSQAPEDAQRQLEKRALRNVRGLVDRIEEADRQERRTQRRLLAALAAGALALAGLTAWFFNSRDAAQPVVIEPGKQPALERKSGN